MLDEGGGGRGGCMHVGGWVNGGVCARAYVRASVSVPRKRFLGKTVNQ